MHRKLLAFGLAGVLAGCGALSAPTPRIEYTCDDGALLVLEPGTDTARVTREDGKSFVLPRQPVRSGFSFSSGRYDLTGNEREAVWTSDTQRPARCTAK